MSFSDQPFAHRYGTMGDTAERHFLEYVGNRAERWGINRPNLHVQKLPSRVRGAPDYLTEDGFVECMGIGRKQILQVKLEKWGVLRWWNDLMSVSVYVWDSHRRRQCLVGLTDLDVLLNTPDVVGLSYFDGSKLVFTVPADTIFAVGAA